MDFQPDYRHFARLMKNRRPDRLPLYEHIVSPGIMEKVLGSRFAGLAEGRGSDLDAYFGQYCRFFREMTYDTVSCEVCVSEILPGPTALGGGRGPVQSRADFRSYPWAELPALYRRRAWPRLDALATALPPGMKAVGGIGNGVFELAEALVGLEHLPCIQVDDPDLYADLFRAVGDLLALLWKEFLARYGEHFVACRFGDDLGFKSSLLTNPSTVRGYVMPQYRRLIALIHESGSPFLWHSCGCIFEIMEDAIAAGIDARHSNEDAVAPFTRWIGDYGSRIALLGGFDMDFLCTAEEGGVYERVRAEGARFRSLARGYALGSGNSIPDYVPVANYLAMVGAARDIRRREATGKPAACPR